MPALRERLGLGGDGTTYDKALADAVKKYQQERELKVSGLLTQQTLDASTAVRPTGRSTRSLPISSAGAGCRTTSARIM